MHFRFTLLCPRTFPMDIAREICTDSFYTVNKRCPCNPLTAVPWKAGPPKKEYNNVIFLPLLPLGPCHLNSRLLNGMRLPDLRDRSSQCYFGQLAPAVPAPFPMGSSVNGKGGKVANRGPCKCPSQIKTAVL